jgi:hypothetical protein
VCAAGEDLLSNVRGLGEESRTAPRPQMMTFAGVDLKDGMKKRGTNADCYGRIV